MKTHFLYDKLIFIKFLIFYYKKLNWGKSLEMQIILPYSAFFFTYFSRPGIYLNQIPYFSIIFQTA